MKRPCGGGGRGNQKEGRGKNSRRRRKILTYRLHQRKQILGIAFRFRVPPECALSHRAVITHKSSVFTPSSGSCFPDIILRGTLICEIDEIRLGTRGRVCPVSPASSSVAPEMVLQSVRPVGKSFSQVKILCLVEKLIGLSLVTTFHKEHIFPQFCYL